MSGVPVVFIVYNRLDTTARVFERIAEARPEHLLVVADGPRPDRPGDAERCQVVRDLVSHPNWNCAVHLNLAPTNLGFNRRISSGLQWAFSQFEEVIVLEDDCLPDPTFFPYCADLLERYRFDDRIMMISGDNFQFGRVRGGGSYYLSHGVGTWGWAGWRRAFGHFDPKMRDWPDERRRGMLERIWPVSSVVEFWTARFDEAHRGDVDAWDYQWAFAMWRRAGLQIAPNVNLISYIGCLPESAHTTDVHAPYCNLPTARIGRPLRDPEPLEYDPTADLFEFYRVFLHWGDAEADSATREALRSVERRR
jgi:hypothetical protein